MGALRQLFVANMLKTQCKHKSCSERSQVTSNFWIKSIRDLQRTNYSVKDKGHTTKMERTWRTEQQAVARDSRRQWQFRGMC